MGNEFSSLTNEKKKSIKCHLAVNFHCQQALLEVVHSNGLPKNEEELYQFFAKAENRNKIRNLQKKKLLKDDQVDLLLPQNQKTYSNKWDITLICVVIINFTNLPPPTNGWKKELDPKDVTVAAFVVMARHSRNKNNHSTLDSFIDDVEFKDFFTEMRDNCGWFECTVKSPNLTIWQLILSIKLCLKSMLLLLWKILRILKKKRKMSSQKSFVG